MKTVTAWLLAATVIAGGAAEIGAVVLCVGDDGHTDIEILDSFRCAEADAPTSKGHESGLTVSDSHCGDCVDLQLTVRYVKATKTDLDTETARSSRRLGPDIGDGCTNSRVASELPVGENLQASQSSVVLLI